MSKQSVGFARVLLPVVAITLASCVAQGETESTTTPVDTIPLDDIYPPHVQCMIENGMRLVDVDEPEAGYGGPGYEFESNLPQEEQLRILEECRKLAPEAPAITDAELKVIYNRWLDERECLRNLGYSPVQPPSFEKFAEDWRSPPPESGPWDPLMGVDTGAWTDTEYQTAKDECTLEFFDR